MPTVHLSRNKIIILYTIRNYKRKIAAAGPKNVKKCKKSYKFADFGVYNFSKKALISTIFKSLGSLPVPIDCIKGSCTYCQRQAWYWQIRGKPNTCIV